MEKLKLIILIKLFYLIFIILIFILLFYLIFIAPDVKAETEGKYFIMNITFYSLHSNCISDKWNDGLTATMTPIREGVVAINVDFINGEWKVVSPLKLGDKILIEGLGEFSVEDTGRFGEADMIQDIWTVDVFEPDYEKAIKGGRQLKKVYVIND